MCPDAEDNENDPDYKAVDAQVERWHDSCHIWTANRRWFLRAYKNVSRIEHFCPIL
jgi:hypothetical protein